MKVNINEVGYGNLGSIWDSFGVSRGPRLTIRRFFVEVSPAAVLLDLGGFLLDPFWDPTTDMGQYVKKTDSRPEGV